MLDGNESKELSNPTGTSSAWFPRYLELIGLPVLWFSALYLVFVVHQQSTADQHSICGPWGCGPPTKTLVAVHIGWLLVLAPPLLYFPLRFQWRADTRRRLANWLILVGWLGMLGIIAWQLLVWLPAASQWTRPYLWQRCGFVIATAVDWPLVQLFTIGLGWRLLLLSTISDTTATLSNR